MGWNYLHISNNGARHIFIYSSTETYMWPYWYAAPYAQCYIGQRFVVACYSYKNGDDLQLQSSCGYHHMQVMVSLSPCTGRYWLMHRCILQQPPLNIAVSTHSYTVMEITEIEKNVALPQIVPEWYYRDGVFYYDIVVVKPVPLRSRKPPWIIA